MDERNPIRPEHDGYPPSAAGLDPVAVPREPEHDLPSFDDAIAPRHGVSARDMFYYPQAVLTSERFKRKDFSFGTWVMIVIAGIVLGASLALMAAGA